MIVRYSLLAMLALLVAGCGRTYYAGLENRSGTDIVLRTVPGYRNSAYANRETEIRISAGEVGDVAGLSWSLSSGDVLLLFPANGTAWRYTFASRCPFNTPEAYYKYRTFGDFPLSSITRLFRVDATGRIYALPAKWIGWDRKHYKEKQPPDFPFIPERRANRNGQNNSAQMTGVSDAGR